VAVVKPSNGTLAPTIIPEPSTFLLFTLGFFGLLIRRGWWAGAG
jgi:hypothetical protein